MVKPKKSGLSFLDNCSDTILIQEPGVNLLNFNLFLSAINLICLLVIPKYCNKTLPLVDAP